MRRVNFIIMSILFLTALCMSILAAVNNVFPGDMFFSHSAQSYLNDNLTPVMIWSSWLFDVWRAVFLVILGGLLVWKFMGKLEALMLPLAGITTLFNYSFKAFIDRPRPSADQVQILVNEYNNGFPSSHAFFTTVFLGMVAYLIFTRIKNRNWRISLILLPLVLILLVGFSRVYLGVHWPSDVIGGYLFGAFFLFLLIQIYEWRKVKTTGRADSYG